ncbi:MAG: EamA family transporter [Alphaproteobacteria bacterium]|nr:EamA family transporter [Alphaproteobacteria bacterium]
MPPEAIAAALLSALIHAGWNAALKAGRDRLVDIGQMAAGGCLFGLVMVAFVGAPPAAAWPYLAVSSVVHVLYWTALARGYAAGDMSHVYTIARGSAPALVTLAAIGAAGETPALVTAVGVATVSLGIMAVGVSPKAPPRATLWALITGASIATYSLVDALGARVAGDAAVYIAWSSLGTFLPMLIYVPLRRGPRAFLEAARGRWMCGMIAGALSNIGFGIILWAQMRAPIGPITALRETSVVFGAIIAALVLKETVAPRRWLGVVLVVAGAAAIGVAR